MKHQIRGESLDLYLNEASRTELLDKDGEKHLGRLIQKGLLAERHLEECITSDNPTQESLLDELVTSIEQGRDAQNAMIQANLLLVASIARRFPSQSLSQDDLIQEGNIGLMRAVQMFDPEKGFRFTTYATWWIKQSIRRALGDKDSTVRIPIHRLDFISGVRSRIRNVAIQNPGLAHDEVLETVAGAAGLSVSDMTRMLHEAEKFQDIDSLNRKLGDDDGAPELGDTIAAGGESSKLFDDVIDLSSLDSLIASTSLTDMQRHVLRKRLSGNSTEEIAESLRLSKSRVLQIEAQGIHALRKVVLGEQHSLDN